MSNGCESVDLFEGLCQELAKPLLAEGWTVRAQYSGGRRDPYVGGGELGSFARPLRDDFVAMAMFGWEREYESDRLVVVGRIGIEYEPAKELLTALTGVEISGVALKEPSVAVRISSVSEVSKDAEELVRFASEQVLALREFADVDTVIDMLHRRRVVPFEASMTDIDAMDDLHAEDAEGRLIPALFAGAGRYEEARRALEEYDRLGLEQAWSPREYRRFARQLTRLLDMGGGFSLPTTPPRWPACPAKPQPPPSFRQLFVEQRPVVRARQEAVRAVRAISKGKTRDELRTLLVCELDQREVSMDQSSFETTVDLLVTERERFGRARIAFRVLRSLSRLGVSARKPPRVIREGSPDGVEAELEPEPALLKPPDRAAYPIWSVGDHRVAVELDLAARSQLDRVIQDSSSDVGEARFVEVWFTWASGSSVTGSCLSVHIGAQRVGQLDVDASEHFRPAMEAAADRDEDPWMTAYLKRVSGEMPYVLEIALPEPHGE